MAGRILLVGCGHMGFAFLSCWREEGWAVDVVEVNEGRRGIALGLGACVYEDVETLRASGRTGDVEMVVYCVRPQVSEDVVCGYNFLGEDVIHVSVMAGVGLERLASFLGGDRKWVRMMPNTPVLVGKGMMVSMGNEELSAGDREKIDGWYGGCGRNEWIEDEGLMNVVTALSGSGPAYVFYYIELMGLLGESLGLDSELSEELALRVVEGAAEMVKVSRAQGVDVGSLKEGVISRGGTTEAAFRYLDGEGVGLREVLEQAVTAARDRAEEIGS